MQTFIKLCNQQQLPEILDIFNYAILHSTALYDYHQRNMDDMWRWYEVKQKNNYPVIGVFDSENVLLGFGTYGMFRERPAYKYTVEHSLYVRHDKRGLRIGETLMQQIIEHAQRQQYHVLVGGIDAQNDISIRLHEKMGFTYSGTIAQAGFKFGRWLDLCFYQKILQTPARPIDG